MKGILVKEEEAYTNGGSSTTSSSSSNSSLQPKPMEGLHETAPPPFLTKTFDVVEDPSTDGIVSWSRARNSFVVWDLNKFSTAILPRYFKHSNFSSFVRQLNTYGFRKVDPDRWEFANEGFLAGQRNLLRTIKRRRNVAQSQSMQRENGGACIELGEFGLEGEIERLRRDRSVLVAEIVKLRQQQNNSRDQLSAMEARLLITEKKHQQMMAFLAKALSNQSFIQQLANNKELKGVEMKRKRRLTASSSLENLENLQNDSVTMMTVPIESMVDYSSQEQQEGLTTIESEIETLLSAYGNESKSEIKDYASLSSVPSANESNLSDWEDLLNQELVGGDPEDEVLIGDFSQIDVPVEDLVEKNDAWTVDLQNLVDQMDFEP